MRFYIQEHKLGDGSEVFDIFAEEDGERVIGFNLGAVDERSAKEAVALFNHAASVAEGSS